MTTSDPIPEHSAATTCAGERDSGYLQNVICDAVSDAKRLGADAAEGGISVSAGLEVNVRMGEVETIEHTRDKSFGVSVYFGHKKGSASTTDLAPASVSATVEAACRIARYTAEDDCAGLAEAELMATEIPELALHHPWSLSAEEAKDLALETEQAARDRDPRITNSDGAGVSRQEGDYAYANSHGFVGSYATSRHSVSCTVIAEDHTGMQRDYWYSTSRDPRALEPPADIGRQAADRTLRRLGARQIATCAVPVLYQAEVARGLFHHLVSAIRGGNLYRRASFLLDHLGKQVFADAIRVHEQPHLVGALGSCPFDNEGVATRARDVVTGGVLQGYVLDSYSARKLAMRTTGNAGGVHNLSVTPGNLDFDGLLEKMGTGLLVTELMGMGINTVTGDYSRGASGAWVEGGKISHPVEEVTIAGNLKDMYLGIRGIGTDVDTRGNIRTGSVLIEQMTVAGT